MGALGEDLIFVVAVGHLVERIMVVIKIVFAMAISMMKTIMMMKITLMI